MKRYVVVVAASIAFAGCADMQRPSGRPLESMETGVLVGAGVGAVLGAVAYHRNRSKGALIGAVGGGLAGAAVGSYMDSQKRDLEKNLGQEIQSGEARVEKLPNDVVRITMTSHTAFDTDSVNIKPGFHSTLDKLADVVVRYGKTSLTIVGHTDNVGSDQYNQKLSERRAVSVAQYFESRRVSPLRLATLGKGEGEPVASNNTESGRSANRRVEIYVEPVVGG
ncbi:MAG: OmpA family protein [Betaproteobacteria bacterium]|nr:MAG: OmpA family protein [Betaproteobacteria bacterium]